jgi:hypothetical protein
MALYWTYRITTEILHCMWLLVMAILILLEYWWRERCNLCAADTEGSTALHIAAKAG